MHLPLRTSVSFPVPTPSLLPSPQGMGEPLMNADAVRSAIELMVAPHGVNLSPNHITVSTVRGRAMHLGRLECVRGEGKAMLACTLWPLACKTFTLKAP